ncbi:MAG TPA: hypothetical protein VFT78_06105 [Hanamia sp.]|nr:hypothetical protein [Hanamia sp.]
MIGEKSFRYEISLKQQLLLLGHLFFTTLFWIGFGVYNYYVYRWHWETYRTIFLFFFFIDILPTIILHLQYLIKNWRATFFIFTEAKHLEYRKGCTVLSYSFEDIDSLQYFYNLGKGSGWNSFGEYRFYKIIFKDKTEMVITCLMINDIEHTLEMLLGMKAEKRASILNLLE